MEHLYRIDIEVLAEEIYQSIIEKLSGHGIFYGDNDGTRIEVISQDSEVKTEG